jgi:hypothetical protein
VIEENRRLMSSVAEKEISFFLHSINHRSAVASSAKPQVCAVSFHIR